jgi:hypothetical protein
MQTHRSQSLSVERRNLSLGVQSHPLLHAAGPVPAYANYSHYSQHSSGFGQLRVETSSQFSNSVQMQAAGFVEGYLTALQINDHWHNQRSWMLYQTQDVDRVYSW